MTKAITKWVVDGEWPGPREELLMIIPRTFVDDNDYYFLRRDKKVVPASMVFDTPQEAAWAAVELNKRKIRDLEVDNERLKEWSAKLDADAAAPAKGERG